MRFKLLYAALTLATTGFVWFYSQPLASDMPLHMAMAKAYADYLAGQGNPSGSPYHPYLAVSSYELPELLLVPLILLFGIDLAWKLALSLYALVFPLSVGYLVGKLSPASRYARLVGFPVTLGYFFHWGFWPFLVGLVASLYATGISLAKPAEPRPRPVESLARFITFLCHPIPALCVGLFDLVRLSRRFPSGVGKPSARWVNTFAILGLLWLPAGIVALAMLNGGISEGGFSWTNLSSQVAQLFRPFYLTRNWYEFALPLAFAVPLTYRAWRSVKPRSALGLLLMAGAVCVAVGMAIPRGRFIGSWENGARVILYGFILLSASWALIERESKALILGWVISGTVINLWVSHGLWRFHEAPFSWAMDTLDNRFKGYRIIERGAWTGAYGVALGNNLPTWAWCKGIAADAKNIAGVRKTGPAYYSGLPPEKQSAIKTVVLYYHPYRRLPTLWEHFTDHPIYFDESEIYSLQERTGSVDMGDEADASQTAAKEKERAKSWLDGGD